MKGCAATVSSKNPDLSASPRASLVARFSATVDRLTQTGSSGETHLNEPSLLIALSGGLDSVVLLSLATGWRDLHQCSLRAIYIDHGLQQQSAEWGEFCAALCSDLNVEFKTLPVTVDLESGLSPEAAARDARYEALQTALRPGEYLCTAHHADDQAETLLLQLFRGAGVQGLASMPQLRRFGSGYLMRPLLHSSRSEIQRYAADHALGFCEDPSNADGRYDRNYLRNDFLPPLQQRWPQLVANISRSASHCAESLELLNDLAKLDYAAACKDAAPVDCAGIAGVMPVVPLQTLSDIRKKNLLRYWISLHGFKAPSTAQLQQILIDLVTVVSGVVSGGSGRINFGDAAIARYQETLFLGQRNSFEPLPDFEYQWHDTSAPLIIAELDWSLDIAVQQNLKAYAGQILHVRNRRGGERWRPDPAGHSVSVKSLLQQRRIPPWQRSRLVFVFSGETLVDICGPGFVL